MGDADSLLTHLIARPGADEARIREVLDDAVAAVPAGYRPLDAPDFLPTAKLTDRCRLCGLVTELTREHIPPKAAGNDRTAWSHTVDDWIQRDALGELRGGTHTQGGIRGYTLCGRCNSKTGELYGEEYKAWALRGFQILTQLPHPAEIDAETKQKVASVEFRDVRPGRFVRQVLSCMCSLSADWDLAGQSPGIRSFVLDGRAGPMPAGLRLGMELYAGRDSRYFGPQLRVRENGEWAWLIGFDCPPFGFQLSLASNTAEPDVGIVLDEMTELTLTQHAASFEADFIVGFGWTPSIGDYRSRGMIESD